MLRLFMLALILLWLWSRHERKRFIPKLESRQGKTVFGIYYRRKTVKYNQREGPSLEWKSYDIEFCIEPQPIGKALEIVIMVLMKVMMSS